jgi:hypothetical protein
MANITFPKQFYLLGYNATTFTVRTSNPTKYFLPFPILNQALQPVTITGRPTNFILVIFIVILYVLKTKVQSNG